MDQQVKEKWIKALRSGEYKQGVGSLRRIVEGEHRYCCLGVLCELCPEGEWHLWHLEEKGGRYFYRSENSKGLLGYLPKWVQDWAGLEDRSPEIEGVKLTRHNDGSGALNIDQKSFEEIADLIEKYL